MNQLTRKQNKKLELEIPGFQEGFHAYPICDNETKDDEGQKDAEEDAEENQIPVHVVLIHQTQVVFRIRKL